MFLKSIEHRLPNIEKGKKFFAWGTQTKRGQTEIAAGMFFLLFLAILLYAMLQMDLFRASSQYMEDALAASNLASAVIDVEEYGISHNVLIDDPMSAYERYQNALKENLNLDDSWQCENRRMIGGPVSIEAYIVYNCTEDTVSACSVGEGGITASWEGVPGQMKAPNGAVIENTGIYSAISYPIEGFLGVKIVAAKGKLVDIALNAER